jgi:hypothetical protein
MQSAKYSSDVPFTKWDWDLRLQGNGAKIPWEWLVVELEGLV